MCQQAQFDLGVVTGEDVIIAFARHKEGAYFPSLLCTDGNILQIRIRAAEAARSRHHLVKGRINTACYRRNERFQTFQVRRNQLFQSTELQYLRNDRVLVCQFIENSRVGRISCFRLFDNRQFLEENRAELFRRIDIEYFTGIIINGFFQDVGLTGKILFHVFQLLPVNGKTVHFHDGQGMQERYFDRLV